MIAVFATIWALGMVIIFYGVGFFTGILYVDSVMWMLRITDIRELGLLLAVAILWPLIVLAVLGFLLLALLYGPRAKALAPHTGTTIRTPKA